MKLAFLGQFTHFINKDKLQCHHVTGSVLCLATLETKQKKLSLYMNTNWTPHYI